VAKDVYSLFLNVVQNPHEVEAFHTHTNTHSITRRQQMLRNRWVLCNILQIFLVSLQPG